MVSLTLFSSLVAVVPAAGVGKRMKASCPKQYLKIDGLTILEHTVLKLLFHPNISQVILVISEGDEYVNDTSLVTHPDIIIVNGGNERVDSVLAGLKAIDETKNHWVSLSKQIFEIFYSQNNIILKCKMYPLIKYNFKTYMKMYI